MADKNKQKLKTITQTGIMLAMLIIFQAITKGFGTFVTGSCVNLVLALSVLACGLTTGLTVAILSPFFAFILGIGPAFLPIVPGIALGNAVLVLILHFMPGRDTELGEDGVSKVPVKKAVLGTVLAAVCKFLTLFIVVVKLILPLMEVNEKQAAMITASFSWPQLVTACIGTTIALLIFPRIKKAIK